MKPIDPKRLKLGQHKIGSIVQQQFGIDTFYKILNGVQCWGTMLLIRDNFSYDLTHALNPFWLAPFDLEYIDPKYDF